MFNSSLMVRRDAFKRMSEECKWYLDNNYFFDSVWAYWFAYHNSLYKMEEQMSAYRVLENSDCHSSDETKALQLEKRYYQIKLHFLLTHDIPVSDKMSILLNEYDYLQKNSIWRGEMKVRNTRSFKLIKRITKMLKSE